MISNLKKALIEVYKEKRSYSITAISTIVIYSLNAIVHNYQLVFSKNVSGLILLSLIQGFHRTIPAYSVFYLIIISLFTGVLVSMSYYLVKRQINSGIYTSGTGVVMSILAPACSSCAIGIFGLLGLGGIVTILPFKGIELGAIGIIVVVISLLVVSKKVTTQSCQIK